MLTKRLSAVGNSVGLIIDKPLLDLLDLEAGSEVQLEVDKGRLIISAASSPKERSSQDSKRSKIASAHQRVMAKHTNTFRKLAK